MLTMRFRRHAFAHEGMEYLDFLAALHARLEPKAYLEIGTERGRSLSLANCASIAVDPKLRIAADVIGAKPACHFVQTTGDAFFASGLLPTLFPGGIDLAFLDGLHLVEALLRDFINTERHCRKDSLIVLHDCLPPLAEMAEREHRPEARRDKRFKNHWTGDVWKLLPILKAHRSDLRIVCVDAPPSGLVICGNLDPDSRVLDAQYDAIVETYRDMSIEAFGMAALFELADIRSSRTLLDSSDLRALVSGEAETQSPPSAFAR